MLNIKPDYVCRFVSEEHVSELVNLYHLARTALADDPLRRSSRHAWRLWASSEFAKLHPEVSVTGAYKDLEGLLA